MESLLGLGFQQNKRKLEKVKKKGKNFSHLHTSKRNPLFWSSATNDQG